MDVVVPVTPADLAGLDAMVRRLQLRTRERGWSVVLEVPDGPPPAAAVELALRLDGVRLGRRSGAAGPVVPPSTLDLDAALAA